MNAYNELWLEAAFDNFQDALESGDYALVKDIIADTFDKGFSEEARVMNNKLRSYSVSHFSVPSPYQHA